jgi:hypothetical protein
VYLRRRRDMLDPGGGYATGHGLILFDHL